MGRVSGKVVIVTGGAGGLGSAFAERLVDEGARVVLTDVRDDAGEAIAKRLGRNASFLHHDVTLEEEWSGVISKTLKLFGSISTLVNNAGVVSYGPIQETSEASYRRVIDINQLSVFLGIKAVLPAMRDRGGGSIINISSVAGMVGVPQALSYTASKFAVRGMTKSAALELAPFNIRVNSIHPGIIDTAMAASSQSEDVHTAAVSVTPAGRIGNPIEVANMVLLLASNELEFATGAEFVIDGGFTSH
jgi:3alpha(or 20beta)-hydroxysteroid dehydrogenase